MPPLSLYGFEPLKSRFLERSETETEAETETVQWSCFLEIECVDLDCQLAVSDGMNKRTVRPVR